MRVLASTLLVLVLCCGERAAAVSQRRKVRAGAGRTTAVRSGGPGMPQSAGPYGSAGARACGLDCRADPNSRAAGRQLGSGRARGAVAGGAMRPPRISWPRRPINRDGVLVQVQDALTSLAEGELARIEAEVAAEPHTALEQARTGIRQATRALENLDKQLTEQVARSTDRTAPPIRCRAMNWSRCRTTCGFSWPAPSATRHFVMRPRATIAWPR